MEVEIKIRYGEIPPDSSSTIIKVDDSTSPIELNRICRNKLYDMIFDDVQIEWNYEVIEEE